MWTQLTFWNKDLSSRYSEGTLTSIWLVLPLCRHLCPNHKWPCPHFHTVQCGALISLTMLATKMWDEQLCIYQRHGQETLFLCGGFICFILNVTKMFIPQYFPLMGIFDGFSVQLPKLCLRRWVSLSSLPCVCPSPLLLLPEMNILLRIHQCSSRFTGTCNGKGIRKMQVEEVADPATCSGEGPPRGPSARTQHASFGALEQPTGSCAVVLAVSLSLCPATIACPVLSLLPRSGSGPGPWFSWPPRWLKVVTDIIMTLRWEKSNYVHICSLKL